MKRLSNYRKSSINHVHINYGGKVFEFNIYEEAKISEEAIEREITTQPSKYALLFILHKKLLAKFETLKQNRKGLYGRLLGVAKTRTSSNGRPLTDKGSEAWVEAHKKYKKATEDCIKAKTDADILQGCVRAFEQRKDLMQTLSSNIRKERI